MSISGKIALDDKYRLGIHSIDKQRKKLFETLNRLYDLKEDAKKEELKKVLHELNDYMGIYFNNEEEYMTSISFPDLKNHKKLHQNIIDSMRKIISTPAKLSIIKTKVRVVVKRYLLDHMTNEDIKIRAYTFENKIEDDIFELSN
ncbi:bacteriohemerythrin [Sulfurimonas sp.]